MIETLKTLTVLNLTGGRPVGTLRVSTLCSVSASLDGGSGSPPLYWDKGWSENSDSGTTAERNRSGGAPAVGFLLERRDILATCSNMPADAKLLVCKKQEETF